MLNLLCEKKWHFIALICNSVYETHLFVYVGSLHVLFCEWPSRIKYASAYHVTKEIPHRLKIETQQSQKKKMPEYSYQ